MQWFRYYVSERILLVNIENKPQILETFLVGVPQGSILGPLLFLINLNDMSQTVKSTFICRRFTKSKNSLIKTLKISANHSFVDKKVSIHFREDKNKLILFASKRKLKNVRQLNIRYKELNIKQYSQVTYLG